MRNNEREREEREKRISEIAGKRQTEKERQTGFLTNEKGREK